MTEKPNFLMSKLKNNYDCDFRILNQFLNVIKVQKRISYTILAVTNGATT